MTPTQTSNTDLNATQIYDLIMGGIEPDLTTDMLPLLDDIYADETEEQRAARARWYDSAFDLFAEDYQTFVQGWKKYYADLKQSVHSFSHSLEKKDHDTAVDQISDSLDNS
jgi:hypothetical protein